MSQFANWPKSTVEVPKGAKIKIRRVGNTDGFDGHALRAVAYWGHLMPDIDPNSVESVNSLKHKDSPYKHLRQASKTPTFALTYQGTWSTLVRNSGFSPEEAKAIEARYHETYRVSDEWVQGHLQRASRCGYVVGAFGLRLRTPLVAQVILNTRVTPREAAAEARTAGNMLGQSFCLMNSRAMFGTMAEVKATPRLRHRVKPCGQIHDACYYLVRDDLPTVTELNRIVVRESLWQKLPEIQHPQVKLGGRLEIFYPSWAKGVELPAEADEATVARVFSAHYEKIMGAGKR
jgi:DNA polymerase-1